MKRMSERERQLLEIQQIGFMTDDLRLYLDTHSDCAEAFSALKYYLAAERELKSQYEQMYGALTVEGTEKQNRYSWICGIWPWELEG